MVLNLIKQKAFIIGFLLSYFGFFILTIPVLNIRSAGFGAGWVLYGFPFTYLVTHCYGGFYVYSGLIGNALTAAVIGLVSGLSLSFCLSVIRPKVFGFFASPDLEEKLNAFRRKWYL